MKEKLLELKQVGVIILIKPGGAIGGETCIDRMVLTLPFCTRVIVKDF
jgi:hypothetical protein